MTVEFAAYLRTSTEESQSPEDSRRWQLSLAQQLIGAHQGRIVAVYHDIDVSRSLPWSRPRSIGPWGSASATKNKLQPGRNGSTSGWSYVVAGAGFEPATFGL